jgi:hypothetical protein
MVVLFDVMDIAQQFRVPSGTDTSEHGARVPPRGGWGCAGDITPINAVPALTAT